MIGTVQTGLPGMEEPAQAEMFAEFSDVTGYKTKMEAPEPVKKMEGQTELDIDSKLIKEV